MSSFNSMLSSHRARNFGGTAQSAACEPYLSGYCFIKWLLPKTLDNMLDAYAITSLNDQTTIKEDKGADSVYCADILSAACIGVTPPGQAIDFVEYQGSCGVKWNNPTKVTYGNTITVKYLEMSGIPVFRIHKCWFDMIRNAHQGMDDVQYESASPVRIRENWCANLLYWTTKPDGVTVEFAAAYSGVTPERDNQEIFGTDLANIDKVEVDITYRIDHIWTDKWVYDKCQQLAKTSPYGGSGSTLWSKDGYMNNRNTLQSI